MKIGILTFPNSPSFGAALQMTGLYRAIENLGNEVEIINYSNEFMSKKKHIQKRNSLKTLAIYLLDIPGRNSFMRFEKQLKLYPSKIIYETEQLKRIVKRYDYLICGSDQVWNPNITGDDLNYFFSFCEDDAKKISYAASFGVDKLDGVFAQAVKEQLEKFKAISVREEQGAKIVYELLNSNCAIVLDPTMLIEQNKWRLYEKKLKGLPSKYIAKFIFNYDKNVEEKIEKLAEQTGLPVVTIGGTFISKLKSGLFTGSIGPAEWLYVLDHADYVVTDSFHGAAFSVIFHKNLLVSLASSTNSRLKTLLHTFELDNRVIGEMLPEGKIDYRNVERIMIEKREESLDFLRKAVNGD